VAFKIHPVIPDPEPKQRATGALELAEVLCLRVHYLLGQPAKFAQDLELEFLGHPGQLYGASRIKDDLERTHRSGDVGVQGVLIPSFTPGLKIAN
jgi:hypothetical protein